MKLRLPHKFQAALMAALASVSFTTLSSGTIAVATGAALLTGQKAGATSHFEDENFFDKNDDGVYTLKKTGTITFSNDAQRSGNAKLLNMDKFDLTLSATGPSNHNVKIDALTGSGNLTVSRTHGGTGNRHTLWLGTGDSYTGDIVVTGTKVSGTGNEDCNFLVGLGTTDKKAAADFRQADISATNSLFALASNNVTAQSLTLSAAKLRYTAGHISRNAGTDSGEPMNDANTTDIWASASDRGSLSVGKLVTSAKDGVNTTIGKYIDLTLIGTGSIIADTTFDAGSTITVRENADVDFRNVITLVSTIQNAGSVILGGTITVNIVDISSYEVAEEGTETYSGKGTYAGSGYLTEDTNKYYLVHSTGSGTLANNAIIQGVATSEMQGNNLVFSHTASGSGTYYVNTDIAYDGTEMADATSILVTPSGTLSIGGSDAVSELNSRIAGNGTVVINADTSITTGTQGAPYITHATGTLRIAAGKRLTLGDNITDDYLDFSSFSAVELENGAVINLKQRPGIVLNNVSVAAGATAHIGQANGSDDTYNKDIDAVTLRGTTLVNGELQMGTQWKWQMSIDELAGSGTLVARGANETHRLIINSAEDFSGTLKYSGGSTEIVLKGSADFTLDNGGNNSNTLKLETAASDTVKIAAADENLLANTITVQGGGALHLIGGAAHGQPSQNTKLKTVTASNLHLDRDTTHNSRFVYDGSSNISGVDHLYFDGAQMWLNGKDLSFSGGVTFNATTYTENNQPVLNGAAMRINNSAAFNGSVEVNDYTKLAFATNGTDIAFGDTVTGSGQLDLKSWDNHTGSLTIGGDASGYQGFLTSDAGITLNVAQGGQLSLAGGSNVAGAVTLDGTLTMNGDTASTISGAISGSGTLTQDGAGTLTLSGDNSSYSGTTAISAGKLVADSANALGSGPVVVNANGTLELTSAVSSISGNVNVGQGGTLKLAGANHLAIGDTLTLASGSILDLANITGATGTESITLATTTNGISGDLTGVTLSNWTDPTGYTSTLETQGNNLVLTFAQEYDGLIWDNASTSGKWNTTDLNWHTEAAPGSHTAFETGQNVRFTATPSNPAPTLEGNVSAGTMTIDSGVALTVNGDSNTLAVDSIQGAGASLTLNGGTVTVAQNSTVGSLNGSAAMTIGENATLTVGGTADSTYSGVISGAGNLTKTGDYTLTLNGSNTISGDITVSGGTLKLGNADALGTASSVSVATGGTLDINGAKDEATILDLTLAGGKLVNSGDRASYGSKNLFKSIELTADSEVNASGEEFGLVNGGYDSTQLALGTNTLTKTGTGTFNLVNTTVTGTGFLKAQEGILYFNQGQQNDSKWGSFESNLEMAGGRVQGDIKYGTAGTIKTTATSTLEAKLHTNGSTLTFDGPADLTVSGVISDAGSITKTGVGTVTLSGNNSYTGGTTISAGTLATSNTNALGSGNVSISEGSTLEMRSSLTIGGELSGAGDITYTGTQAGTLTLTKAINQNLQVNISATGTGKLNLALNNSKDYTFSGNVDVNDITHATNVSMLVGATGNVTATGTVTTGRLELQGAKSVFALSGPDAQLKNGDTPHQYGLKVQGSGTFAVADHATQSLTGDLASFSGTFLATGAGSELTLASALNGSADLSATDGGKIVLTSSVTGADTVTIGSDSTLQLANMSGDSAITASNLTLASGSILDLSALSITGQETSPITLVKGGTIDSSNLDSVVLHFATEIQGGSLSVDDSNNLVLTFTQPDPGRDLIWQGGPGEWNTDTANEPWYHKTEQETWELVAFEEGDNVSFSVQTYSPVSLTEDITAGDVTIDKGVEVSLSSGTAGKVDLNADDIVVNGDLTVTNVGVNADEMIINEGGHVTAAVTVEGYTGTMETDVSGSGDVTKAGAGSLALTGDNTGFTGTLTIEQGNVIAGNTEGKALGDTPNIVLAGGNLDGAENVVVTPSGNINITSTADGTVSANLEVADGAVLTFNTTGNTTITASGVISSAGDIVKPIVKTGTGTLVLDADNSYAGALNINQGTVLVSNVGALGGTGTQNVKVSGGGTLAFDSAESGSYTANYIGLDLGSTLTFAGVNQLNVDTLFLTAASAVDLSNITVDGYGKYVLANVGSLVGAESGIIDTKAPNPDGVVSFISMTGLNLDEDFTLKPNDIISLHYKEGQLYLEVTEAKAETRPGYYWKPDTEIHIWDTKDDAREMPGTVAWYTDETFSQDPIIFPNKKGAQGGDAAAADSVYFLDAGDDNVENVYLDFYSEIDDPYYGKLPASMVYVRDFVLAGTKKGDKYAEYNFYGVQDEQPGLQTSINLDTNRLSNFIVRSGVKAYFNNVVVDSGDFSVFHVCDDAFVTFDNVYSAGSYSLNNEGTFNINFNYDPEFVEVVDGLLGHVDNYGDINIVADSLDKYSMFQIGAVFNREEGNIVMLLPEIHPNTTYGDQTIHNMGYLQFGVEDSEVTGTMANALPIVGTGDFVTTGQITVEQSGSVEQEIATFGALRTELSGGATIGDVTLAANATTALAPNVEIDPYLGRITSVTPEKYFLGPVTAESGSVLEVQKGATVEIDSYNAVLVSDVPTGKILAGTNPYSLDSSIAAGTLTVKGVTNAAELEVLDDGIVNLEGYATVTKLTQSGGEANFNAGGYVGGGTVSGGTLNIKDDQVLTLGGVIEITASGSYVVGETTGHIDATALELQRMGDGYVEYAEVVSTGEAKATTVYESGFLASGDELVQLFAPEDTAAVSLTGNSTKVVHDKASGEMVLIGTDNLEQYAENLSKLDGSKTAEDYVGYAYLHTQETNYMTYFVRDDYVTGLANGRKDEDPRGTISDADAPDRAPNSTTLGMLQVAAAAKQGTLTGVMFDQTAYNLTKTSGYDGTLTVDRDANADMFYVTSGTTAMLHVAEGIVLSAGASYDGVPGNLDLQGEGIYQLTDRADLGTNVDLRNNESGDTGEWNGTVRLIGTAEGVNMEPLSVGEAQDASTIEFNEWTGSFAYEEGKTMQSDAKILLTGTGVQGKSAITLTEGDADLLWTNTVTGTGARIDHAEAGDFSLEMTGDTSGWNGTFTQSAAGSTVSLSFLDATAKGGTEQPANVQNANVLNSAGTLDVTYGGNLEIVNGNATVYSTGDMNLAYTGTDMQVNSNISKYNGQGTADITVGDGTNEASATFNGDITADTLTVETNADATLHNTTQISQTVEVDADASLSIQNADGADMAAISSSNVAEGNATITRGVTMKSDDGKAIISGTAGEERPATRVDGADVAVLGAEASLQIENLVLADDTMVYGADSEGGNVGNLIISQKVVQEMSDTNTERVADDEVPAEAQKMLTMTGTRDSTMTFENDKVLNLNFASMCQMAQISGSAGTLVFDFTAMPDYYDWENKYSAYGFIGVNFDMADKAINASDLTVKALTKDASGQVVERIGYYYNGGDGAVVGSIIYFQVPEPTTGTLSLLALCALAARRRRK